MEKRYVVQTFSGEWETISSHDSRLDALNHMIYKIKQDVNHCQYVYRVCYKQYTFEAITPPLSIGETIIPPPEEER